MYIKINGKSTKLIPELSKYLSQKRCGKCASCKYVEDSKSLLMPNPYLGEHANQSTIDIWNQILVDNPCETWEKFNQ